MRRIKNYLALSLFMAISYSCEKETIDLPKEDAVASENPTFFEFLNSGIDVNNYIHKVRINEVQLDNLTKSHANASNEEALFDEFCSDLPVEGFEKGEMNPEFAGIFKGPLNEFTCCHKFDTGDILPGISISADQVVLALYGQETRNNFSKVIYAQYQDANLYVDFTSSNVNSFSLDILSFPYPESEASQEVTVEVYNDEEELVHSETITSSITGSYWAFLGDETIGRVSLSSTNNDAWIGVDNIAFGECSIPDADNDGCLNNDDPTDSSNMEATIIIGTCDSGIANRMTSVCGITLADDVDRFEDGDYRNHGALVKEFAHLTDIWVSEGLITSEEKGLLMSCAAKAGF